MNVKLRTRAALAALLVSPALALAAPQNISACQTISLPGSYTLNKNLIALGDCIVIAASFVTLDLNGFVISGSGTGTGIQETPSVPFPGFRGVVVRNGAVTNFANGVYFPNSTGVTVDHVNATLNTNNGIELGQRPVVTSSRADENGGTGMLLDIGASVTGNTVGRNHASGIVAGEGAIIVNNEARNNGLDGIFMDCPGAAIANTAGNNLGANLVPLNGSCTTDHNSTL
jgi:hypothetical protein